jgi:hypothetical protein
MWEQSKHRQRTSAWVNLGNLPHVRVGSAYPSRLSIDADMLAFECQKGISQYLDDRHDYVCLNFGSNLAAAMFFRNRRCDVVGCSLQFSRFSGLDFVAKNSPLTIGNGRKAR